MTPLLPARTVPVSAYLDCVPINDPAPTLLPSHLASSLFDRYILAADNVEAGFGEDAEELLHLHLAADTEGYSSVGSWPPVTAAMQVTCKNQQIMASNTVIVHCAMESDLALRYFARKVHAILTAAVKLGTNIVIFLQWLQLQAGLLQRPEAGTVVWVLPHVCVK
jgi:hypothetical protein